MSDSAHRREWRFYVRDMIGFCERVLNYTAGHDQATFLADSLRYDATIRNLELIGEAATHVPQSVRDRFPATSIGSLNCGPCRICPSRITCAQLFYAAARGRTTGSPRSPKPRMIG